MNWTSKKVVFVMPKEPEKKKEERTREGAQAWADYQAGALAGKKTARFRALRLARDAVTDNLAGAKKKK